jgi:hypothetical protein
MVNEPQEGGSTIAKQFVDCHHCGFSTHKHHFGMPATLEMFAVSYTQGLEQQVATGEKAAQYLKKMKKD